MKCHYEEDNLAFPASAYAVRGHGGIAWHVHGWQTEPDEDTEWTGYETRTGRVVCTMIGDDRRFVFDPEDLAPIDEEDYCHQCGQIGCGHDGLER